MWPETLWDSSLWKWPVLQTLLKAFDISSATAQVVPGLLKAIAVLSDTNDRRSAADWEPKTILEIRKKATFL